MIISPRRRYIFVHIPKTGGTSMAAALEARAHRDDILIGDTPKALRRRGRLAALPARGRLWKHATLADIDGILTSAEIARMFTFTLVRNPWDRMVSYYHWLQGQAFAHPAVARAKTLAFAQFVQHPATLASLAAHPARHYMRDAGGVERALLYLRLEELEADMAPLVAHLGFRPDIGHANASPRGRDWRPYYDADSADAVAKSCADDISRFGYRFG
ncbi:sulfotransferase family 2 domain-containing protein [Salipiger aestuarii]|uniref:sulfotransferase family 2 domain-containing protein n=1 Tax=Salipiger aestuarii TaxID=568098 RepID=UPI001238482A|nr:sulfotransferase family 2 domain-containing protein [Salipiger aestuarii]KAA8613123.1 Type II secretory pathway, pullulanase PulA [Salipiger aestuarii]